MRWVPRIMSSVRLYDSQGVILTKSSHRTKGGLPKYSALVIHRVSLRNVTPALRSATTPRQPHNAANANSEADRRAVASTTPRQAGWLFCPRCPSGSWTVSRSNEVFLRSCAMMSLYCGRIAYRCSPRPRSHQRSVAECARRDAPWD